MKTKESFFISLLLVFILVILQSTLFYFIASDMVIPDFALIVVAFFAARRGMQEGQILGFFNGLAEDFITSSFPGFNALIKTIIGFLAGTIKNKMLFDPVIFPSLFIFFVTLLKGILAAVTGAGITPPSPWIGSRITAAGFVIPLSGSLSTRSK